MSHKAPLMEYPNPASPEVTKRMREVRRRDTGPERLLRSELHRRGLRYRVEVPLKFLPRHRVDVVFSAARVAVFIDGCFWHACPQHGSLPKSNSAWWQGKFERVRQRDAETDERLRSHGWAVVRVWEHEAVQEAADRIEQLLTVRRSYLETGRSIAHRSVTR